MFIGVIKESERQPGYNCPEAATGNCLLTGLIKQRETKCEYPVQE